MQTFTDYLIARGWTDKLGRLELPGDCGGEAKTVTTGQHFMKGSTLKTFLNDLPDDVIVECVDLERYPGKIDVRDKRSGVRLATKADVLVFQVQQARRRKS
jgi:hypothetical protein